MSDDEYKEIYNHRIQLNYIIYMSNDEMLL